MQTFLPHPDFRESARVLDRMRLGKQRVETLQIMQALCGAGSLGWKHHPAVKMWAGFEIALLSYQRAVCYEWAERGYRDTCLGKTIDALAGGTAELVQRAPPWLGDAAFHASHRSNLLQKDPAHYSKFGWAESLSIPYVWPVR